MMCLSLPIQQEGREILLQNFHDEIAFLANKFEVRGDWYSIVKRDFAKVWKYNCIKISQLRPNPECVNILFNMCDLYILVARA